MPRYTTEYSVIHVVGPIWQPGFTCAYDYIPDLDAIRGGKPFAQITREDVQRWLQGHTPDFESITDFAARLSRGGEDVDIPWATEDGEIAYNDAMFPIEGED